MKNKPRKIKNYTHYVILAFVILAAIGSIYVQYYFGTFIRDVVITAMFVILAGAIFQVMQQVDTIKLYTDKFYEDYENALKLKETQEQQQAQEQDQLFKLVHDRIKAGEDVNDVYLDLTNKGVDENILKSTIQEMAKMLPELFIKDPEEEKPKPKIVKKKKKKK